VESRYLARLPPPGSHRCGICACHHCGRRDACRDDSPATSLAMQPGLPRTTSTTGEDRLLFSSSANSQRARCLHSETLHAAVAAVPDSRHPPRGPFDPQLREVSCGRLLAGLGDGDGGLMVRSGWADGGGGVFSSSSSADGDCRCGSVSKS